MDENFFKQLDEALTNVGSDKYWERTIGGHVVWLSPVPFKSQHKINELLTNNEIGTNVIGEVKRMTMSYAIVGFDGFDLRPYRNETPQFPAFDPREKKQLKVALHKYLSYKMDEWGTEWVDSAFDVFADIMETIRKDNLKEVKFENARSRQEELAELEEKVRDLRNELEMPPLVELDVNEKSKSEPGKSELESSEPNEKVQEGFNPFQKLPVAAVSSESPVAVPLAIPVVPPKPAFTPRQTADVGEPTSSPDRPYVATQNNDVLEKRFDREEPPPIEIDPVRQSVNPRFRPVR